MKIFSEKTNQEYQSVEECLAAEKEFDEALAAKKAKEEKLAEARKSRAIEVEEAYKAILEAQKNYNEKLNAFIKDYGSFHMTLHTGDFNPFDGFENLFSRFWS
jgi:hypothetical protein